jgi:hypothetical protein
MRETIVSTAGQGGLARDDMSVEAKRTRVATILIVPYCTSPSLDPTSRFSAVSTLHSPFLHNITEDQTHPLCVIGNSDLRDGYRESIGQASSFAPGLDSFCPLLSAAVHTHVPSQAEAAQHNSRSCLSIFVLLTKV